MICRLCRAPASRPALTLTGMPRWNQRLLQEAELVGDTPVDLIVQRCAACGFVSLPPMLDEYYSDYVNAPSGSPQMLAFLDQQAAEFVDMFSLRGRMVLEVGCGDGGFLAKLRDHGAVVRGIEPSAAQRQMALARGLAVEDGILTAERRVEGSPFDAFATRQVFEHVEDMHGFLAAIRAHLNVGGVGLVEVPNLDLLLAQERFFDFIPEHVNYFSQATLKLVLDMAGFTVLAVEPVQDGEALRALVRWTGQAPLNGLVERVARLRAEVTAFIQYHQDRGESVAIWGAGGKGLSMLAVTDLRQVAWLVDGDPHKHGRYTPVSHLRVSSPEVLLHEPIGAVIIMAPAYRREILHTLRTRYGFRGRVGVVGANFDVMNGDAVSAG